MVGCACVGPGEKVEPHLQIIVTALYTDDQAPCRFFHVFDTDSDAGYGQEAAFGGDPDNTGGDSLETLMAGIERPRYDIDFVCDTLRLTYLSGEGLT